MNRRELCLRAFPAAWRDRYGAELCDLLATEARSAASQDLDLLRAGLRERGRGPHAAALRRAGVLVPAACAVAAVAPAVLAPATAVPTAVPLALVRPAGPAVVAARTTPLRRLRPRVAGPGPVVDPLPARRRLTVRLRAAVVPIARPLVVPRPRPG